MPLMPLPRGIQEVEPRRMIQELLVVLEERPLQDVLVLAPEQTPADAPVTRVPYLLAPLVEPLTITSREREHRVACGEAVLFLPGARCRQQGRDGGRMLRVTFDIDLTLVAVEELLSARNWPKEGMPGRILPGPPGALVDQAVEFLVQQPDLHRHGLRCAALARTMLETLMPRLQEDTDRRMRRPDRAEAALSFIQRNAGSKNLDRARVARAVGVHPNHLSRLLKGRYGSSFSELVMVERLRLLKDHLRRGALNLDEIAEASGFRSRSSLIDAFKRRMGCTPGAWRKEHRKPISGRAEPVVPKKSSDQAGGA